MDYGLEGGWGIDQFKMYDCEFEEIVVVVEGCFLFIFFFDLYEVEFIFKIDFGEVFSFGKMILQFIYEWQRIFVGDGDVIECFLIYYWLKVVFMCFFFFDGGVFIYYKEWSVVRGFGRFDFVFGQYFIQLYVQEFKFFVVEGVDRFLWWCFVIYQVDCVVLGFMIRQFFGYIMRD